MPVVADGLGSNGLALTTGYLIVFVHLLAGVLIGRFWILLVPVVPVALVLALPTTDWYSSISEEWQGAVLLGFGAGLIAAGAGVAIRRVSSEKRVENQDSA